MGALVYYIHHCWVKKLPVIRRWGLAVLVLSCCRFGIWPRIDDKSCYCLFFSLFSKALGRLGQMNKTKAIFIMLIFLFLISLSSDEHMSSCPCSIPPALSLLLLFSFLVQLRFFIDTHFPSFFLSFLPSPLSFSSLKRFHIPLAFHRSARSPPSYPQHIRCSTNESSTGKSMMPGP